MINFFYTAIFFIFITASAQANPLDILLSDIDNFRRSDKLLPVENEKTKSAASYAFSKKLFWTPTLSAVATRNKRFYNKGELDDTESYGLNANWNLFRGGADYHSMLSASAAHKSQQFQEKSQSTQLESKAAEIIFRKILLDEAVAANIELKKQKEEALRIAQDRYRSGRISQQELNRIEVDLSQQLNRTRQTEMEKIDLEQKLKSSYIQKISTKVWPLDDKNAADLKLGGKSSESQKLYWASQAKKFSWRSSYLKHMPSLDLSVDYQKFPLRWKGADAAWSSTITFSIPFWNQWQNMSDQAQEYAGLAEAETNFELAENEEKAKTEALQKKLVLLAQNVTESKNILKKSEKLYESTLTGFRYGKVSANDLFSEQNRLIETRLDYSQNQLTYHMAIVETCLLTGSQLKSCLR